MMLGTVIYCHHCLLLFSKTGLEGKAFLSDTDKLSLMMGNACALEFIVSTFKIKYVPRESCGAVGS